MYRTLLSFVFLVSPTFAQAQIDAIDGSTDAFGQSVDILSFETGDKLDVMVVGDPTVSKLDFYERESDGFDWTLVQTFSIPTPTSQLGFDVELDYQESTGEYHAIAGAPGTQERAYVFTRDAFGSWNGSGDTLILPFGTPDVDFGSAVDIDFNGPQPIAVVAAAKSQTVYCYRKQSGIWNLTQTITEVVGGDFGTSLAYDDNMLAVGAPGVNNGNGLVFTYDLIGINFVPDNFLTGQDSSTNPGSFGTSIDLESDLLVVGAPTLFSVGTAFVFRKDSVPGADFWVFEQRLDSATVALNNRFGTSVDIGPNNTIAVGDPAWEDTGLANDYDSGTVNVFVLESLGWQNKYQFEGPSSTIPGETEGDNFGTAVALDAQFLAVGRPRATGENGVVDIFSTQSIVKSQESIDKSIGGRQVLIHTVDPMFIGDTFFLVGSLSPTFVYDNYSLLTIQNANTVAFTNTLGSVGAGPIQSTINIPGSLNQPTNLYHTYFILEPGTVTVNSMSDPEVLTIF